jgi:DNA helicase II / ATP-dependent DNA helicase PcrA
MPRPSVASLLAQLNPEQREAALTTQGPVLVLAGAGSGKTRVITVRMAHLLDQGVPASKILAVTFTNKAAREMKERIRSLMDPSLVEGLTVSTFHSLGLWMVRKSRAWLEMPHNCSVIDESDRDSLLRQVRQELSISDKDLSGDELDSFLMQVKGCGVQADKYASSFGYKKATLLRQFLANYNERLRIAHCLDFDDLILLPVRLLEDNPEVARFYSGIWDYVMVDEYQDTNWLQFRLIQQLVSAHSNLCVVGDDDQSIYGWRGARVENILEFDRHFAGCKVVKLTRNYRSEQNILELANAVISKNKKRRPKELWTDSPATESAKKFFFESQQEEAEKIADEVRTLMGRGIRPVDMAVLYRTRGQSRYFQEAFRLKGVPYKVVGSFDFFERKEIRDLLAYLRLAHNPRNEAAFRRVVNVPARGVGLVTLRKLDSYHNKGRSLPEAVRAFLSQEGQSLQVRTRRPLTDFVDGLDGLHSRADEARGMQVCELTRDLLVRFGLKDDLMLKGQGPLRAMHMFLSIMERFFTTNPRSGLEDFLEKMALDQKESDHNPEDGEDPNLTLMTIHAAKGLEFEAVFLVGMVEGLFPHFRSITDAASIEEERRLFYVALTRAKKRLYISNFRHREERGEVRPSRPSRFLKELPRNLLSTSRAKPEAYMSKDDLRAKLDALEKDLFG